ncbi:penicillin acylase II [Tanticharoenia sakaeratensis NBRC 103193]|uniref:Penicillin acylase II n=1 Tax=Tanticharoenia sakaeratensis NBRC 103193 TaxID=1231623 RepID=A0A0D6MNT9_9PROT|nr:penicillin acylase II [Tanticharoenia sakaeratensis NBRC 103193]GBQ22564.1 penicillin amidase [Tanticharoenia sakaeratensis NBRC 103193]
MTRTSRRLLTLAASLAAVISATGIGLGGFGWHVLHASRSILSEQIEIVGLSGPVVITRDAQGTPRIVASSRPDLARALGFLHGQERFFEMDLMRHAGAGALSELVGRGAVLLDQRLRLHRFAQRARHLLGLQSPDDRALLDAYSAGVNAGLHALGHPPFEYSILRVRPRDWQPADSLLVVYAMYLDLQPSAPRAQQDRAMLRQALGPDMAAFLMPRATPLDAPIDGSVLPAPPMPETMALPLDHSQQAPLPVPEHGSNSFAVSGHLTATGSAMLANDMHLALSVPNIWYRAELVQTSAHPRHLVGVTLPGEPFVISGSNGAVTWALTDGYIETGEAIRLDPVPGASNAYQTPDGPRPITTSHEHLVVAHGASHDVPVEETIWGPVMGRDASGVSLVWRWSAHDDNAIQYDGFRGLEDARSVQEGLDAAHHAGLPQQNILLADAQGHIAWSIIGPVPDRYGVDDGLPHSWASGDHGWHGYLTPDQVPQIIDPPGGRLWTANGRMVGGDALRLLGDGGYADGLRASRIRDDLYA